MDEQDIAATTEQSEEKVEQTQAQETGEQGTEQVAQVASDPLKEVLTRMDALESKISQQSRYDPQEIAEAIRRSDAFKQSQRAITGNAVSAQLEELRLAEKRRITELARAGKIDPAEAALSLSEIDGEYGRAAIEQQRRESEKQQDTRAANPQQQADAIWHKTIFDALDMADMTGEEPEFQEFMRGANFAGMPWDAAERKLRAGIKEAKKKVEARVNKKPEPKEVKKPVTLETGGSGAAPVKQEPQEELRQLLDKGAPDDPKLAKQYWKRIEELGG